jgi:hypothetical protein
MARSEQIDVAAAMCRERRSERPAPASTCVAANSKKHTGHPAARNTFASKIFRTVTTKKQRYEVPWK